MSWFDLYNDRSMDVDQRNGLLVSGITPGLFFLRQNLDNRVPSRIPLWGSMLEDLGPTFLAEVFPLFLREFR